MLRIEKNRTTYSQNFLKSSSLIKGLLYKSSISVSDFVLEIGSGKGIITKELARICKQVLAFEIDSVLYEQDLHETASFKNVRLVNEDFLTCRLPETEYKVFSNIPFLLTSRIIRKLTDAKLPPRDSYLVMQEEAANKFLGLRRESQASLLLKPWFEPTIFYRFSSSDFKPIPKVNIVMLRLLKRKTPLIPDPSKSLYGDFIVYITTRWKPSLRESLENIFTGEQMILMAQSLDIDMEIKPLDLKFEGWIRLFNTFLRYEDEGKKKAISGSLNLQRERERSLRKVYRTRLDKNWREKGLDGFI